VLISGSDDRVNGLMANPADHRGRFKLPEPVEQHAKYGQRILHQVDVAGVVVAAERQDRIVDGVDGSPWLMASGDNIAAVLDSVCRLPMFWAIFSPRRTIHG
jgi:hypothetical protein